MEIIQIDSHDKQAIESIVTLHKITFSGFFLASMNRGFLRYLYRSVCEYEESTLLAAVDGDKLIGFIAFGKNISNLYKYMIKHHIIPFMWYSLLAFLRKPSICGKLFRALKMPKRSKRDSNSVKVSSIGVDPEYREQGVGSKLLDAVKVSVDFSTIDYITLETDKIDNDPANAFYIKNGFRLSYVFETPEGRVMNVYHYHQPVTV